MFDVQPDDDVPGFRVEPMGDVPGFRVSNTGSPLPAYAFGGGSAYPDASIWEKIRDPEWVVPRASAALDGAISVIPGTWNAVRALGRAAGVAGKEEAERFDQEMALAGKVLGKAAEYPQQTARGMGEVWSELDKDPLFRYRLFGRALAGGLVGIGPVRLGAVAALGDAMRAAEKGYGVRDWVKHAIEGNPWLRGADR